MLELVFTRRDFVRCLERLSRDPTALMVGTTGIDRGRTERVLVRQLRRRSAEDAARWLRTPRRAVAVRAIVRLRDGVRPDVDFVAPGSRLALVDVGLREQRGRVAARLVSAGRDTSFDRIAIPGARLDPIELSADRLNGAARRPAADRYSRTRGALTEAVYRRTRELSIAIVGLGRSGAVLADTLVRGGFGRRLLLLDADRVESANLDGMIGADSRDVGRPKVDVVADHLRSIGGGPVVVARAIVAQSAAGIDTLRQADVIFTTVDADAARLTAAVIAATYLRVHVDIGTGIFDAEGVRRLGADVRLLVPGEGCVRCVGGLAEEERARADLRYPDHHTRPRLWSAERSGSLAPLNMIAVGRALVLWLDHLAGRFEGTRWERIEVDERGALGIDEPITRRSRTCPVCRSIALGDLRFHRRP